MKIEKDPRSVKDFIPAELAKELQVIGLRWVDEITLQVAVSADLKSSEKAKIVKQLKSRINAEISVIEINPEEIRDYFDLFQTNADEEYAKALKGIGSGAEGPISELTAGLLSRAVRLRASDVHFEPTASDFVVRARIDGKLEEIAKLPNSVAGGVVSRIKVLADMNIVERRRAQDGQFRYQVGSKDIDVRVGTIATIYGEKAVVRLLDTRRTLEDVVGLGMSGVELEKFKRLVSSHYGLIVVAGPTGAGKTTTLHSAIRDLNNSETNVSTLEDPVEYVVQGVNHIPVIESIGAGFAAQLRGLLRQDPDVIMVGEMRDEETARIGIQAALAGRLVLTSFHATDCVAAVFRLLQMGIEPHLIAASLKGVVAQRLLRRVCNYCKVVYEPDISEKLLMRHSVGEEKFRLAKGIGCEMCRNTGYRERVGVFQIMEITDELRELISKRPNPSELYAAATASGLPTLSQQAQAVALRLETSAFEANQLVSGDV